MKRILLLLQLIVLAYSAALAQTPIPFEKGTLWYGSYHGADVDTVNLQNGSLSLKIPLFSLPQKGRLALSYSLVFSSNNLRTSYNCYTDYGEYTYEPQTYCAPFSFVSGAIDPSVVIDQSLDLPYTQPTGVSPTYPCTLAGGCPVNGNNAQTYYVEESDGARHQLMPNSGNHNTLYAADGSGYRINASSLTSINWNGCPSGQFTYNSTASGVTPGGITHNWAASTGCISSSGMPWTDIYDRTGNHMSFQYDGASGQDVGGWPHSPAGGVHDSIGRDIPGFPASFTGNADGCPNLGVSGQTAIDSKVWTVPGPNGANVTYRFCYTSITYNSHDMMQCLPAYCFDGGPNGWAKVMQSVVLPTGTYWGFVYDSAGMFSGNWNDIALLPESHPEIRKLIYPTGGSIDYAYASTNACNWGGGSTIDQRYITYRQQSGTSNPWSYQYSVGLTRVVDPDGNHTVHHYENHGDACFVGIENAVERYQGSGTLLQAETIQHTTAVDIQGVSGKFTINAQPSSTTKQLAGGVTVTSSYSYPALATGTNIACGLSSTGVFFNGNCSEASSHSIQFANPTRTTTADPSSATSSVVTSYEWQNSSAANALAANDLMLTRFTCLMPGNTSTCGSAAGAVNFTDYSYDASGNKLSSNTYDSLNNAYATTGYTYTSSGRVASVTDPRGNTTYTAYDGYDLFPIRITRPPANGVNHISYYQYDTNTGNLQTQVDENGSSISDGAHRSDYSYDTAGRLIDAQGPPVDGQRPRTRLCYTDNAQGGSGLCGPTSAPYSIYTRVYAAPSPDQTSHIELDGFGRTVHAVGANNAVVDTSYDNLGRAASVSNPHFGSYSSTDGTTTFTYDALGRKLYQYQPDGTNQHWTYSGDTTDSYDEAGKHWQRTTDGLGRLTDVLEPHPGINTPALPTHYTYDLQGNLATVSQTGVSGEAARNRSFTYDSRSRLITSNNPETGIICYGQWSGGNCVNGYDLNGNLRYKTDARGVVANFSYDPLNRLTHQDYTVPSGSGAVTAGATDYGWLPADYYYDQNSWASTTNAKGRLSATSTWLSPSQYSLRLYNYDAAGRPTDIPEQLPSESGGSLHGSRTDHDLAGNTIGTLYPDGRYVKRQWNSGGQLMKVTFDNWNGTHVGYDYLASAAYFPDGSSQSMTYGNGVTENVGKDNRRQVSTMTFVGSSSFGTPTLLNRQYCYVCNPSGKNNGNIDQISDLMSSVGTQNFTYDALNRIVSFSGSGASQTYSYDSFGNLSQSGTLSSVLTFAASNRISSGGYGYDSGGNVTSVNNGVVTTSYGYNPQGAVTQVNGGATAAYRYDGEGNRIRKDSNGVWTEYQYLNGQMIAEKHYDGSWSDFIYANGKRIARADGYDQRIHMHGTNPNANGDWTIFQITSPLPNRQVQTGDKLSYRQYNANGECGGIDLTFSGGGRLAYSTNDQNGVLANFDSLQNTWHTRTFSLTAFAGQTITGAQVVSEGCTDAGAWDQYVGEASIYGSDGNVWPLFARNESLSMNIWGANTNAFYELDHWNNSTEAMLPGNNTTYYLGDHLGSISMEIAAGGWPTSMTRLYPFGQTLSDSSQTHYKFTGKERDPESGLDYFGARFYTNTAGRFMSPDNPFADQHVENPQSWNMYSYVLNSPLLFTDPTGRSTHTNAKGDVFSVVDDGDLGVYREYLKKIKKNGKTEYTKVSERMGETAYWDEFENMDHSGVAQGAHIIFGATFDSDVATLNTEANKEDLHETASKSKLGQHFDIKSNKQIAPFGAYTGKLLNGKYASARSAGNFLAGENGATGTMFGLHINGRTYMKLAGALQQGKFSTNNAIQIITTGRSFGPEPWYGEQEYSGRRIKEGFDYGATQRK